MRKIFFTLTTLTAMAMLLASCEKNTSLDEQSAITIEFNLDDDSGTTKSSSTAQLSLNNGCTVAFYSKSSGNLLATGSCEGSTRKIVITSVPTENCNVYAVGNTTFDWPSSQSALAGKEMAIDVTKDYIPRSTRTGSNAYSWNVGSTYLQITDMPKMYSKISVYRNQPSGTYFTATSARVLNCPNTIYPFGNGSTGTTGTKDTASSSDITLFNNGNHFTLWVPSDGSTQVELKGTRTNGSGINYTDTYTITVPAISREDSKNTEVIVNGESSGDQIVIVIGDDTRSVSFGTSTLNVVGDGTNYSTYVKGVAGNGETGWTYNLSWTGVSELAGNTTISVNGQPAVSLGTSGSISLPGDGNNKNIVINSTYSGSTQKTINLATSTSGSSQSSYLTVNITKSSGSQNNICLWDDDGILGITCIDNKTTEFGANDIYPNSLGAFHCYEISKVSLYNYWLYDYTSSPTFLQHQNDENITITLYTCNEDAIYNGGVVITECQSASVSGQYMGDQEDCSTINVTGLEYSLGQLYVGIKIRFSDGDEYWVKLDDRTVNEGKPLIQSQCYFVGLYNSSSIYTEIKTRTTKEVFYEEDAYDAYIFLCDYENPLGSGYIYYNGPKLPLVTETISFTDNFGNTYNIPAGADVGYMKYYNIGFTSQGDALWDAAQSKRNTTTYSNKTWHCSPGSSTEWWKANSYTTQYYKSDETPTSITYTRYFIRIDN